MTGKGITRIGIIKRGDIPEVTDLHAIVEKNHISEEIILEKPKENLPEAEKISLNMSREEDQMTDTGPMDQSVIMKMPLHTEVIPEEELLHTVEKAEETSTTVTINLTDIGENPVALTIDTAIITTETDRALLLTEESQ